ncbi:MAG: T9SS type A sorting domain-containing protein, partial [Flavobacteriales bacterium]
GCTTTSACVLFCLPATSAMSVTACGSYTTPSGSATYTASGTYFDTVLTALGCDSVLTIELAIVNSTASIASHIACDSFTWIDGNTYTESNNAATIVLTNAAGCDSLITLDLTILNSTASIESHIACDSFTWVDGNTYTASNSSATFLLTNAAGCDSTVTLDLNIIAIDTTVTVDGVTLTANAENAQYQWLDCDNALAPIEGASGQSFTPSENGSYAVEITADGCTSISACQLVLSTGVLENTFGVLRVHPNPTTGHVQVALGEVYGQVDAVVRDARGRIVMERSATRTSMLQFEIAGDAGLYLLELRAGSSHAVVRLMKE